MYVLNYLLLDDLDTFAALPLNDLVGDDDLFAEEEFEDLLELTLEDDLLELLELLTLELFDLLLLLFEDVALLYFVPCVTDGVYFVYRSILPLLLAFAYDARSAIIPNYASYPII